MDKVLASLKGHTKRVNHVAFCEHDRGPTLVLSAGTDKTARVWAWAHDAASGKYQPCATICTHKSNVMGPAMHPMSMLVMLLFFSRMYSLHKLLGSTQVYHSAAFKDPFTTVSQSVDLGRSNNPNTTPTKDYENV